jgi:LTXXQ motif family protein
MTRSLNTLPGTVAAAALLSAMTFTGLAFADEQLAEVTLPAAALAMPSISASQQAATVDRDEQRIRSLRDRLQITAAQESMWNDVARVMRSNDDIIDALTKTRTENAANMTAIEDLHSYATITEAHATGVRAFMPVFDVLYASMSSAQKTNADNVFRSDDKKPHKRTQ